MKRLKIQLMALIVLLLMMIGAYIGIKTYNNRRAEEETAIEYQITEDDIDSVTEFSFVNEKGSYTFIKKDDIWYCEEEKDMDIDTALLEEMIGKAVSITSEDKIEPVKDMEQYGLTEPEIKVAYKTAEKRKSIKIGDYNPVFYKYYICMGDENIVYTVDSSFRSSFEKDLEDLKKINVQEEESGS